MAVSTQVVRFTKEVTGAANVTQDVTLNFTPKAIIVFSDCNTADNVSSAHYQWSQGFSDGTNSACVTITSDDADAAADTQYVHSNDSVYVRMTETNNSFVVERATCTFITNGVRFTWAVASTLATRITIWAIGGTDIANAKVNTVAINRVGAGTQNYTGLGFNPAGSQNSVLFTLMKGNTTSASNTSALGASLGLGCAISTTKRWAGTNAMEDTVLDSDTWRTSTGTSCIYCFNAADGTIQANADFSAWISDGFTLNWSVNPGTTVLFSYLCINGGTWDAGVLTSPNAISTNVDYAVSVSSQTLRGMTMLGAGTLTSGNIETNAIISIGAADGTTQSLVASRDVDALATTDSYRLNTTGGIYTILSPTGTKSDIGVFDSFTTNNFRLDWPTKSTNQHLAYWTVVADGALITQVSRTRTHKYHIQTKLATQVIRFQKSTGANGTTQDVTLNFTPKAIIVFSDGSTANNVVTPDYHVCLGFSDGTNHTAIASASDDAELASDTGRLIRNDSVFVKLSDSLPASTTVCRGTCAFATNKVTFTWATNDAAATYITVWAFGGDDITNAKVNTVEYGRNTAGTQDYTGLGFNPTSGNAALFTLTNNLQTSAVNTNSTVASTMLGCAISTTKRWVMANLSRSAQDPTDTYRVLYNDHCIAPLLAAAGSGVYSTADFNGWITDGFQLDWDTPGTAVESLFGYLVINGGTWDCGTLTVPNTATNDVDTTVAVNSQPLKGLMLATSWNQTTGTTVNEAYMNIGATDGTNQSVCTSLDADNQTTVISHRLNSAASISKFYNNSDTNTINIVFDSFGTNSFRLDYPTKDANSQLINWVVVAEQSTSQLYDRPISESTISISESLARVQIILKPINETSITVSETLTRVQTLIKTISETSVTVSETLARIPTYLKPISESAISVSETLVKGLVYTKPINEPSISSNETLVRLPLYLRPISENAISINDTIARWISVSYTLGEPSITVNDSIQGALFYLRQISESAISVNQTLTRILTAIRAVSDPSISTNDTIARIQILLKTITESAISVNDSVLKVPTFVKSISETSITTNDSIVRILAAVRTISDPSISISDTITRIQTILKQISESAISVNDSLQAGLLLTISLIESRVKWYYSLLTRKIQV